MNGAESKAESDKVKFVRDAMLTEISYRRDKMWKLFSWVSTLLTGIIGGVIALKTRSGPPVNINLGLRISLTIAVIGLTLYSCTWLNYNWEVVSKTRRKLEEYSHNEEVNFLTFRKSPIGYVVAVGLLGLAAGLAIWL